MEEKDFLIKGYNGLIKRAKQAIIANTILAFLSFIAGTLILFATDVPLLSLLFISPTMISVATIFNERKNIKEYKECLARYEKIR